MSKAGYLPRGDKERVLWLNHFASKLAVHATTLGLTPADVAGIANDAAMFTYLVTQVEMHTTAKEMRVSYKNLIKDGPIGAPGGVLPMPVPAIAAPTVVAPGIFPRLARLVQRIKATPTYAEAIGKDLGIISAPTSKETANLKPALKLIMKGRQVEVQWVKGKADSIRIEKDSGSGWQFLAIDSIPHYTDKTPITVPAIWKYRAMYILRDEPIGQWSDVASIGVS
ncbi:MAG: hypothetical protein ACK5RG_14770 [Cyclobacteriaceae bacterium]|jgi:hypothetical protein|nr:hypothetical protein [Flammeovirgaceae bacterium]